MHSSDQPFCGAEIYVADAFSESVFGGNPAGVVLLRHAFPCEKWMRALATELKHSETVFLLPLGERRYHLRYFTPEAEVDLCGHATIAAFTVLRERSFLTPGLCAAFTASGNLAITVEADRIWMEMAPPELLRELEADEAKLFYQALAYDFAPLKSYLDANPLHPAIVRCGLADLLLPLPQNSGLIDRCQVNSAALMELSERFGILSVHLYEPLSPEADKIQARCRDFSPILGIPEEAATGTASGGLCHYLTLRGWSKSRQSLRFLQGEAMGRASVIHCVHQAFREECGKTVSQVLVGGPARLVFKLDFLSNGRLE